MINDDQFVELALIILGLAILLSTLSFVGYRSKISESNRIKLKNEIVGIKKVIPFFFLTPIALSISEFKSLFENRITFVFMGLVLFSYWLIFLKEKEQ